MKGNRIRFWRCEVCNKCGTATVPDLMNPETIVILLEDNHQTVSPGCTGTVVLTERH